MRDISIGMNPNMFEAGDFVLAWHGFLTFIAVALAVLITAQIAKREGMLPDTVYSVSVWAIIGGIVGARIVHVIDFWSFYSNDLVRIIQLWNGGIAIYGAVIGGFIAGAIYCVYAKIPVGRLADFTAPGLLIAMTVGRIGDIINGEHLSKTTTMPWGFVYTHPDAPSNFQYGLTPSHPAVVYEMLWNMAVLAMIWPLRNRLRPHGMLFVLYGALYSAGRFFISFLRVDKEYFLDFNQAQILAIIVMAIAVPILAFKTQLVMRPRPAPTRPA